MKIARQNAEATLARAVEATVEIVAENQATQLGFDTKEEATSKFNELSRPWASPSLSQGSPDLRQPPCIHRNPY